MVKVLFPKNAFPQGDSGYVGIFIDGEFLEAVAPKASKDGKYYEYTLDTKTLTDGNHKLEAKLYVDYSNQPRIVDTSSVDITVANTSSIPVPEDGFKLRYRFASGTERIYRLQHRIINNIISEEDQKKQGSRPFQVQEDGESYKILYACDNAYGNGDGLMRMQIVPDRGIKNREYAYLTVTGATEPQKFYPENMAAIYMRITPTGREVFGAVPDYYGLEGTTGVGQRLSLFSAHPLPTLPSKGVKPGDTWASNIQVGSIDLQNLFTQKSVARVIPARGELVGVEWEMGHPCAKVKNTIAQGTAVPKGDGPKNTDKISSQKVSVEETVWFALDTGVVVKYFRDTTIEGKADFGDITGGGGTSGGNGGGPAPAGLGGAGGGKGGDSKSPGDFQFGGTNGKLQRGGAPTGGPAGFSQPGAPPQGGRPGGQFGPGGPGAAGQGGGTPSFVRIRIQELFVLEK